MTWTRLRPAVTLAATLTLLSACKSENKPSPDVTRDTPSPAPVASVEPAQNKTLSPSDIPREFSGHFTWQDGSGRYSVTLSITRVEEKDGELLLFGAHAYQPDNLHATVEGRINPKSRRATLRDVAPASAKVDTEGALEGFLSQDLQTIEGLWITPGSGDKANYKIRATSKR